MNNKLFPIIIFGTLFALLVPLSLKAQTPSSNTNGDKIDEIRRQVEENVKSKIDEITNTQERRGWIGIITEITTIGFQMRTDDQTRNVTLNDQGVILNQDRQNIDLENLEVGEKVIAMGEVQIDGSLDAKRIIITDDRETNSRQPIFGLISETAAQDEIILVKNNDLNYELIFDNNSLLKQKLNGEIKEIEYQDLVPEQKIVAVISTTDGNTATYRVNELLVITSPESTPTPSPNQPEEE